MKLWQLLLDASVFGKPGCTGGNRGGVVWAQEIVVAVRDIDRRVLRIHVC